MAIGKSIGIGALVVVIIIAAMLWRVVANLDSIVAGIIEDEGSDALKTRVSVSNVSIDLREGKAAIGGLTIANPAGFSGGNIFELNGIAVDVNISSLTEDVIVIETVHISEPLVVYETNEAGKSNMDVLLENINAGAEDEQSDAEAAEILLIIDELEFSGGTVTATLKAGSEPSEFKLPAFGMSAIGRPSGTTPDAIAEAVARELVTEIISAAAKAGLKKVIEEKTESLKKKLFGRG
jgi:hypothetical protein